MNKPNPLPPPAPRKDTEGEVTITWATGEVVRVFPDGRKVQRPPAPPVHPSAKSP